jgi:hypothetical protein
MSTTGSNMLLLGVGLLILYVIATNRGNCLGGAFACLVGGPAQNTQSSVPRTVGMLPALPQLALTTNPLAPSVSSYG